MKDISNTSEFRLDILVLERMSEAFNYYVFMKKTQLHLASKLRWDSFMRYLDWLQNKNYVAYHVSHGVRLYSLTHAGKEMFSRLMNFLQYVNWKNNNNHEL